MHLVSIDPLGSFVGHDTHDGCHSQASRARALGGSDGCILHVGIVEKRDLATKVLPPPQHVLMRHTSKQQREKHLARRPAAAAAK